MEIRLNRDSNSRVRQAGEKIAANTATPDDWLTLKNFRLLHNHVLRTFRSTLSRHVDSKKRTTLAQRLKRKNTIIDKLKTGRARDLSSMHDLAGCRLIFENIQELEQYRTRLHSARFQHSRRNGDKYNYIRNPKPTGYRGIHDVFGYNVPSNRGQALNGLLVEVQYRTAVQHAWATAVELSDLIHKSRVKFDRGADPKKERFFTLVSELLSRHFEKMNGPIPAIGAKELRDEIRALDSEIHLIRDFKKLNKAKIDWPKKRRSIILRFDDVELHTYSFSSSNAASTRLYELETQFPDDNIVLVKGNNASQIVNSFRNYFRDSKDFVEKYTAALEENSC